MSALIKIWLPAVACLLAFSAAGVTSETRSNDGESVQVAIDQYQSGSRGSAISRLLKLAYAGNVAAQVNLGIVNYLREDRAIALKESKFWFSKAAEAGDTTAQFNLSMLLIEESGTESQSRSASMLERAAEGGNIYAQTNLGILSVWHDGFRRSRENGLPWLRLAAAAGDSIATTILYDLPDASAERALGMLHSIELTLRSKPRLGKTAIRGPVPVYVLPSISPPPVMQLSEEHKVEIIAKTDGWINVRLPSGLPGWIQAAAVDTANDRAFVKKLETGLYVAPNSDPSSHKFGVVTKGESLLILEHQGEWLQVQAPSRFFGWMRETDVVLLVPSVKPVVEILSEPEPESELEPPNKPEISQETLVVLNAFFPLERDALDYAKTITSIKTVNEIVIFTGPGQSGRVAGNIPADTEILVGADIAGSSLVINAPASGWVYGRLISGKIPLGASIRNNVRVRASPTTQSDIVAALQGGQAVNLLEEKNGWFRIELDPQSGWARSSTIETMQRQGVAKVAATSNTVSPSYSQQYADSKTSTTLIQQSVLTIPMADIDPAIASIKDTSDENSTDQTLEAKVEALSVVSNTIIYSSNSETSRPFGRLLNATNNVVRSSPRGMVELLEPMQVYGWIYAGLVETKGDRSVVKGNGVRIRFDPDTSRNNILTSLNAGESVQIISRQGEWFKVALTPVRGWISPGAAIDRNKPQ